MKFFVLMLLFALYITPNVVMAQKSKEQLEKEKKEILQKIQQNERILAETASKKRSSIGQLNALNSQIESQNKLVSSINQQVKILDTQISDIEFIVEALEEDLDYIKEEYAAMLYAAQKSSGGIDYLVFLFAAKSFNQLVMRLKYLEFYSEVRRNQVKQIEAVKKTLIGQREDIEIKRSEQANLLQEQIDRNRELERLIDQQSKMIAQLTSREKEIRKDIEDRKGAVGKLENLIAEIIRKEIEKRKTAETKRDGRIGLTPEQQLISNNFEENKNRLIWPVNSGFIAQKFGNNQHPVFKNIQVPNDGVDIQTNQNEAVRCIFAGEVRLVAAIPNLGTAVIVQHGEYLTVYANMKRVDVKAGQTVELKQQLGIVNTDKDGVSVLQFQVWKNTTKLNPEDWIAKK